MKKLLGYDVPIIFEDGKMWISHQVETYKELIKNDVVINTWPTGTGKTLAALNAIRKLNIDKTLIIAPINELIRQYKDEVERYLREWGMDHKVELVTAENLDEKDPNHPRALENLLKNEKVILVSNPDIIHYVIMQRYGKRQSVANLFVKLLKFPKLVVFDEFHYYDIQQLFFAIILLITTKYFQIHTKYIFMTATPNSSIIEILEKEGFKHSFIDFEPPNNDVQSTKATSDIFVELLEKNITENTDKIIQICSQNENKDIVIISDSLKRIVQLNLELKRNSINCGLITGPMSKEERQEALKERIILATPTVDIGINFNKPFKQRQTVDVIIFEANSSDNFIQRIGRAGRILGKKLQNFPSYAYCIIPGPVVRRISPRLDNINTRLELNKLVSEEFRDYEIEEFRRMYNSPYRILLGLYEDAISLIFPEDIVKEKIKPYFEKIEKTLGLLGISNRILRKQLNLYHIAEVYFSKEKNNNEKNQIIEKLIKPLEEDITNFYSNQREFEKALYNYMEFIKKYILSFRSSSGEKIYILDKEKITGAKEFIADIFTMITQYNLEKIEVPKDLENQVLGAYKIISPRDKNLKLDFYIKTKAEQGFVIPIKTETGMIEGTKSIKFIGMPIYILDPVQEGKARKFGFKVYNITINGFIRKVVLGAEAIQAQVILSSKPWDYNLFPL